MKRKTLSEISKGKYHVKKDECTYTSGDKKICNFRISHLTINRNVERRVSISITLIRKKNEKVEGEQFICTATLPICYLYEPYGWLTLGFDIEDFRCSVPKKEFETYWVEIINLLLTHNKYSNEEYCIGWDIFNPNRTMQWIHRFYKFEDPTETVSDEKNSEFIFQYIDLVSRKISIPLFSYALLSIFGSLEILGPHRRPDFIMSLTGSSPLIRNKTALFFTNLHHRNTRLRKDEYKAIHIMNEDSLSDIRFKAAYGKDSVIIAFDPDKRRSNQLNKIYGNSNLDEDDPLHSMCLITQENAWDIPFPTLNIFLDSYFNLDKINEHFQTEDPRLGEEENKPEDELIPSIYCFIAKLLKEINQDTTFVLSQFKEYVNHFEETVWIDTFSEPALEIAKMMCFAFEFYMKIQYNGKSEKINLLCKEAVEIIRNTAKNSFPLKDECTDFDFEDAKNVCSEIDQYFSCFKGVKHIGRIGANENISDIRLWYNDSTIYVTATCISEILKLQGNRYRLSKKVKQTLAERGIIQTYIKNTEQKEYSIHIQEPLYGNYKSKFRYIAFNRKECEAQALLIGINEQITQAIERNADKSDKNSDKV